MNKMGTLLAIATLSTALGGDLWAASMEPAARPVVKGDAARQTDVCLPSLDNRVHRFGKMWLNLDNQGALGNVGQDDNEADDDPEFPGVWAPQCEYPGGSGQQYLYKGAIWIGALIVDDTGRETPRVSFGSEGWENPSPIELFPSCDAKILERSTRKNAISRITGASIYDSLAVSEQDFLAVYTDTLENYPTVVPGTPFDQQDGDHVSLGIEVQQESHSWSYSYAQDFIVIDYKITNIGSKFLKNLYVGLYMDADIGHKDETDRHTDDFCGFRETAYDSTNEQVVPINAAYIADNDGRPHNVITGINFTCPHVVGTRVLRGPNPMLQTTFNWWSSNTAADRDYGPCWEYWAEHPEATIGGESLTWCGTLGTPEADINKYQVMANGEFDPPMFLINPANPPLPQNNTRFGDGMSWLMPGENETVQPGGDDTRYLLSWGPLGVYDYTENGVNVYRLNPGESFVMTVAMVAGENFHDRSNPQTDITDDLRTSQIDSSKFDWTDFDFNAIWAQRVYDNEMYDTPIYDTNGDGRLDMGDGWPGEDVGLDGLWAANRGDTVRYFGRTVIGPDGLPAIYDGPDSNGTEGNGQIDSAFSDYWGFVVNEDDFWSFLDNIGNNEMREDSFLIYAGPKFSSHGVDGDDWYIGHFNWNSLIDLGDGIPDFQGPPPPPCPDLTIETGPDYVELVWTRNSMAEDYEDPFSHVQDFEGFRIWASNTSFDSEYSLLFDYDNINYAYFNTDNALTTPPDSGPLEALPLRETTRNWERQPVGNNIGFAEIATPLGTPIEPILLDVNHDGWINGGCRIGASDQIDALTCPVAVRRLDGVNTYWMPDGTEIYNNAGDQADPATGRLFTQENGAGLPVLGERFEDLPDNLGEYDFCWDRGDYDIEFRKRISNVHSLFPRYYAVSAYDFGDYQTGTEPLETSQSCNAIRQAPSGVPGRQVKVVPNPYRVDAGYDESAYSLGNATEGLRWENQDDGTQDFYPQSDRRLDFMNLPEQALVRIFTVSGDLVQILPHNVEGDRSRWNSLYSESWDLNSRNFQQVASGLYFFSVEDKTPGGGGSFSTGKFVIIK